jgi:hypothetical protein
LRVRDRDNCDERRRDALFPKVDNDSTRKGHPRVCVKKPRLRGHDDNIGESCVVDGIV